MAITKKFKVSFDVTLVVPTEAEKEVLGYIMSVAHKANSGVELNGLERESLVQFLTHGMEGLVSFTAKRGIRKAVKGMNEEYSDGHLFKLSPATVREVL